jgi:hypothetical protein
MHVYDYYCCSTVHILFVVCDSEKSQYRYQTDTHLMQLFVCSAKQNATLKIHKAAVSHNATLRIHTAAGSHNATLRIHKQQSVIVQISTHMS